MSYSAKVIADSINPFGNRLTTLQVTFPRFILAKLNTHRVRKFYPYEDDYAMLLVQEQSV